MEILPELSDGHLSLDSESRCIVGCCSGRGRVKDGLGLVQPGGELSRASFLKYQSFNQHSADFPFINIESEVNYTGALTRSSLGNQSQPGLVCGIGKGKPHLRLQAQSHPRARTSGTGLGP